MKICVYGASSTALDKSYIEVVEKLGKMLVERGHKLVYGAGAHGLMGAVARGAHSVGGEIIGVSPKFFDVDGEYISGVYTLSPTLGIEKMMATMKTDYKNAETIKLTFPEGWTIQEIAEKLEANEVCTASSFISTLQTVDYSDEYDFIKKS